LLQVLLPVSVVLLVLQLEEHYSYMSFQEEIQFGHLIYFGKLSLPAVLQYLQWVSLIIYYTERRLIGVKVLSNLQKHNQIRHCQLQFFLEHLSLELSVDFWVHSLLISTSELMLWEVSILIKHGKNFLKQLYLHSQVLPPFIGPHTYSQLAFQINNQILSKFSKTKL